MQAAEIMAKSESEPRPEAGEARMSCLGDGTPGTGCEEWARARPITLIQPQRILFGNGSVSHFSEHLAGLGWRRVLIVTSELARKACQEAVSAITGKVEAAIVFDGINSEPTVAMFEACLAVAREARVDGVIGLGGGSALDVAKLVAALADASEPVRTVFGSGLVKGRRIFLACLPTTAGTGSEVSPNAILLDEASRLKKAVISPHLVPDVACVDPLLTWSVPPHVTAATGLDALTHCIESFANRFAHPTVDLYALEGIRLIARHLPTAIKEGRNSEARARVALGSLYGGLCLGPVNTAAVHALAYPLGSEFGIAHGLSNAILLPHVLRFNLPAAPQRYAEIALALGAGVAESPTTTAERGIRWLEALLADCPMPRRIGELGVPREALPQLAASALTVTRLLENNPRTVTEADALAIYSAAY